MKFFNLALLMAIVCASASGQVVIPADKEALLKGEVMGQTLIADISGFPGPKHALDMKDELGVSRDQIKKIEDLLNGIDVSAKLKGEDIVIAEDELYDMFDAGIATEKNVRAKVLEIGKLRAEFRFIHLQAHLKMKQILSPIQMARYKEIRQNEAK